MFRVIVYTTHRSQVAVNSQQLQVTIVGAATVTDDQLATQLSTLLAPLFKACMSAQARYEGVACRRFRGTGDTPRTTYAFADAGVGDHAGDMLPGQICGLVNFATPLLGLTRQGRMYLPFPPESRSGTDGQPNLLYTDAASLLAVEFTVGHLIVGTVGNATVSFGRQAGDTPIFDRYDEHWVDQEWATQRRRSGFSVKNHLPHR
jgi:hypothetical protein